jgi:hypothetical protein
VGPFQALANAVGAFVQALNPSVMYTFSQAMRDLMATIGVAFAPAVAVLTDGMRTIAGVLLPVMQALAPVFRDLTSFLIGQFIQPFRMIASVFSALAPVLEFITGALRVLQDAVSALSVVGSALIQTFVGLIQSLIGGLDMKGVLSRFRDVMHMVVEAMLKLVAYIAKAFGSLGFIDKMKKNLLDLANPKAGMKAAPQDVGFKGFEDISKSMASAAFAAQAGGGGQDKSEKEWLERLALTLDDIKNDKKDVKQFVVEGLEQFWTKTARPWLNGLPADIANALNPFGN